jgi:hypothetical protein
MAEVEPIEALYYPRVEFPSPAWVKAALLYWEGLLRIVPDGCTPHDPPEVQALVQSGAIQNVSPAPFRARTGEAFGTRLDDLLQSRKGKPLDDGWSCGLPESGGEERVHLTEMETSLARDLESKRLLSVEGEWARMSPSLARLYQITMANEASRQLLAAPVTSDRGCDVASAYFSSRKMTRDPSTVPTDGWQWAQLYTPFPSIEAVQSLSIEKLLELRSKNAHQRHRFRETVQRRTTDIAKLPSAEAVRAQLEALGEEMADELKLQRKALRATGLNDLWTTLGVSTPLAIAAGTALLQGPALAMALGGFGAVGLTVADWFFERHQRQRTEGHYLLSVGKDVDRATRRGDLADRMRRLTHGGP